ncbi:14 kDa phosphohistidine phosphatase-like [Arctopsyche grandis]|uniref:14 kDa phosphohistidine phosphatase-like n=1 Tax=Arctopsyche grandis TaxID=121162 RepID=UPI00406D9B48
MDQLEPVDISDDGVFKYILIRVKDSSGSDTNIVRGYAHAAWHADIFEEVSEKLKPLKCKCLGGGKIDHNSKGKRLEVYGISQAYGKADHEAAAALLKKKYPSYFITVNNDD